MKFILDNDKLSMVAPNKENKMKTQKSKTKNDPKKWNKRWPKKVKQKMTQKDDTKIMYKKMTQKITQKDDTKGCTIDETKWWNKKMT